MIPSRLLVRFALSLPLLALLASCGPRAPRSPLEPLDRAAAAVEGGSEEEQALALAGWHAWLVRGDPARAHALATRAVGEGRDAPWARVLLAELSRREVAPVDEARHLLGLLRRTPGHALARVAARRLRQLGGTSLEVDSQLTDGLEAIFAAGGLDAEAASDLRALRLALASRRDVAEALEVAREAGRVSEVSLVGPLSPYSHLEFDFIRPRAARDGRRIPIPTGSLSLAAEPRRGDVYVALSQVTVPHAGTYLLRLESARSASVTVFVDGTLVLDRRAQGMPAPTRLSRPIELKRGTHLIAARISRGWGDGDVTLELAPADGGPSPSSFLAPGDGDLRGAGVASLGEVRAPASSVAQALEDVGILAAWAGAAHGMGSDPAGVRRLLDAGLGELPSSLPLLALRAASWDADPTLPGRIRRDRAASDWAAVVEGDPDNRAALLELASLYRREGRWTDAEDALRRAASLDGDPAPVLGEEARLASARGHGALAGSLGKAAHEANPGGCDAGALALTAARRVGDVEARRRLVERLASCPGGQRRLLRLRSDQGRFDAARRIAEEGVRLAPASVDAVERLASVQRAAGHPEEAAATLQALETIWPHTPYLPRLRATYLAAAGKEAEAREARLRALELDGSDLALLRMEAYDRRQQPLAAHAPDTFAAIRAFEEEGASHDAPAVILVDFVGVEVHGDGSQVELHHVLTKILDKRAIDRVGEVHIPDGAEILDLRTIKSDGSILEPEEVAGKDAISMRGLEVGDYVDVRFLVARPARDPALPGFSTPRFFFRTRDFPILDSTYVVRVDGAFADEGMEVEVDPHGGPPAGTVVEEGASRVYVFSSRDNPAFIPEPHGVASQEILPWVQVGAGAGEKELACWMADRLAGAARTSAAVEAWAAEAVVGAATPRERIERVWERLMDEIEGEGAWDTPAPYVLANGRGNRAVLLRAALESLGIETSWVALRTFDQDPHPYRFPHPSRLGKLVLVARPEPSEGWLWLDPSVRYGPLGAVAPEGAGMPGWVLPSRGLDCVPTSSPRGQLPRRWITYRLELTESGRLLGEAVERYFGFEGAQARSALERIDEDGLRQVVEGALARGFREVVLDDVRWAPQRERTTLSYSFEAAADGVGDGHLGLDLAWTELHLGRRFLTVGARRTPLLIGTGDHVLTETRIRLPPGAEVEVLPEAGREVGAYGDFRRTVGWSEDELVVRDELRLERGRVLPAEYPAFAAWVTEVDRVLEQGLEVEVTSLPRRAPPPAAEPQPEPEPEPGSEEEPAPESDAAFERELEPEPAPDPGSAGG